MDYGLENENTSSEFGRDLVVNRQNFIFFQNVSAFNLLVPMTDAQNHFEVTA
jgi:hypothetical protein